MCDNWGDKRLLSLMDVPLGASVPAMWGRAKAQPKRNYTKKYEEEHPYRRQTTRSYAGGALQLIIPVRGIPVKDAPKGKDPETEEELGMVNQWLAGMVTRKFKTERLVSNPAMYLENPWTTSQRRQGKTI